jgi:aminoglycoside phosphotransferase family enzyme
VVDWLVKMRRLPAHEMLDAMIARGDARPEHMRAVAARLAAFYGKQPRASLDARGYRALLLRHIHDCEQELCLPEWHLPEQRVRALCERQRALVHAQADVLDARLAAGRVVEGHGDLRPEHVWLGERLAIIDSLEFSAELRLVDCVDEVGFLALECERVRAPQLSVALLNAYLEASGDPAPAALIHFYQSCRACVRARLAIRHLQEPRYRSSPKWRRRALRYLVLARRHLDRAQFA